MSRYKIIKGSIPILLSAPHNFPQIREGKYKKRDIGTGSMVEKMCNSTCSWGIVTTEIQKDPNWYLNSPFRNKLKELIKTQNIRVVLDIHGKRADSENILEIYPNNNFKDKFTNTLAEFNLPVKDFKNDQQLTISEDLDNLGIPAIEIEIRKDARSIDSSENKSVLIVLTNLIDFIN